MEQMALGASQAGHATEAVAEGWLCALLFLHDAPHVPASIVIHMHGCVCLGSPCHKSTALQARFKNENISKV